MTVIHEGDKAFYIGAAAAIIEDGRELAWAERYVTSQPDIKWILGNFVEADHHNNNGHLFALGDLRTARASIDHKPLNMLHREHTIVGCFVGQELLEPGGEHAGAGVTHPHVEALSAFWRYYFPDLYDKVVVQAHKEGTLFYSMECAPKTLTCMGGGGVPQGCGREFDYMGRTHETYCDHLNAPGARKRLNQPHFTAGAIIVPPVKPGWSHADITQLDALIESNLEEAHRMWNQIASEFPHLDGKQWDEMMRQVMAGSLTDASQITIDPKTGRSSATSVSTYPMTPPDDEDDPVALPDGTYTVINAQTLTTAVNMAKAVSVVGADVAARCHILRRAAALGLMNQADVADELNEWKTMYPDWETKDCGGMDDAAATLTFGLYDDYPLEFEVARDFSSGRRADLAKKGMALPVRNDKGDVVGGRYPIVTVADLKNAITRIGQAGAGSASEVKAHIKKRAAALGASKMVPTGW